MIDPPQPASDTRLYLLNDGGVLFSEPSHGLYVLNATAAFVWCCLEDRLERDQIAAAIKRAYGIPIAAAKPQVDALLRQWEELGLLAGTVRQPTSQTLARVVGVRGRRCGAQQGRRSWRGARGQKEDSDAAAWPRTAPVRSHSERFYRLLTTSFRLRYSTSEQEEAVHPVLAHLEAPPAAADRVTGVDLVSDRTKHLLVIDGLCTERCGRINELAPLVKGAVLAGAINSYSYLLYVHAGVVRGPSGSILLPAAPGSGKTSLTAALVRAGFVYFSDEVALLEQETLRVRPVPVSLCIKESAWDLLAPHYPELRNLAVHYRWDEKFVRYLNPPPDALDPEPEGSHPVRCIVFPRYTPGVQTALRPLGRAEALHRLFEQCLAMPVSLDQAKVAALVRWIGNIPCFDLPMSSLNEAVALVKKVCGE